MKSNSAWRSHAQWSCNNHLPSVLFPVGVEKCWYYRCESKQPAQAYRPQPKTVVLDYPAFQVCAWSGCAKGVADGPAPVRPKSKYCSRDCSNKNARRRHRLRESA
jgi:hypothetical protein